MGGKVERVYIDPPSRVSRAFLKERVKPIRDTRNRIGKKASTQYIMMSHLEYLSRTG